VSANRPPKKGTASDNSRERWHRAGFLIALLITLWIAALHVLFLFHAGPLWRDEVGTIDFAAMPTLGDIWQNLRYDNFPPLFVAVARVWTLAGLTSDFSYRLLGCLIGMGTLGVLWWCARKVGGKTPLLVLALYAANPVAIRVGDSLRPYGLGIALTLVTLTLIWNFVQTRGRRALFWAAVAATLSVQCLYQNIFFIIAFSCGAWVVTIGRREWKTVAQTGIIGLVAALSLLPYWRIIKEGQEWNDIQRREIHFDAILHSLSGVLRAPGGWMAWVWLGLLAAGLVVSVLYGTRQRRWDMLYCGTVLVASAALYLVFLQALELPPRSWYFLILMAPAALMVDSILGGLYMRRLQTGQAILSFILIVACIPACYASVRFRQSNIDLVAAKLKEKAQPGDLILVLPWHYGVSLQRYFGANRLITLPPMEDIRIHRYDLMKKAMMTENPIGPLLDKVRATLRSGRKLWLVGTAQAPPGGHPPPVYPPYNGDVTRTEDMYFSSWMFQITYLAQQHAVGGAPVKIPVPGGQPVNPLENVPLVSIRGWRE
jgi:uncharacterized membrane protein